MSKRVLAANQFLNSFLLAEERIDEKKARIRRIRAASSPLQSGMPDGMPHVSSHGDGKGYTNAILELERQVAVLENKRKKAQAEIIAAIDQIDNIRMERVLLDYYIEGKSVKAIAVDEGISYPYADNLLRWGVAKIEKGTEKCD